MFQTFDHTADIGLLVEGKTTEEFFTESAAGMFSIIAGGRLSNRLHPHHTSSPLEGEDEGGGIRIKVIAKTLEELLVGFLNEMLYFSEKEKAIFSQFKIKIEKIENKICLKAQIRKNNQIPKREIKAATYNDLGIERKNNLWQARIIFDI